MKRQERGDGYTGGLVASSTLEAFHEAFNSLMYESAAAHMQIHKACKRAKGFATTAPRPASSCFATKPYYYAFGYVVAECVSVCVCMCACVWKLTQMYLVFPKNVEQTNSLAPKRRLTTRTLPLQVSNGCVGVCVYVCVCE